MPVGASRTQSQYLEGQIHTQAVQLTETLELQTSPSQFLALDISPVLAGDRYHPCAEIPPDLLV